MELLKEIIPKVSRVAVFASPSSADHKLVLKELGVAPEALGVKVQVTNILSLNDIETAFQAAAKEKVEAVIFRVPIPLFYHQTKTAGLAVKSRLPAIYENAAEVEAGGLMSYGLSVSHLYRRAATYVDKILKGADTADLPVEQPTKFEFLINLKAAKQIGLTIPPNVLAQADKIIK